MVVMHQQQPVVVLAALLLLLALGVVHLGTLRERMDVLIEEAADRIVVVVG